MDLNCYFYSLERTELVPTWVSQSVQPLVVLPPGVPSPVPWAYPTVSGEEEHQQCGWEEVRSSS